MPTESDDRPAEDFLATTRRLSLLDEATLSEIEAEAASQNKDAADVVLSRGLLSAVQLDLVQTMRRPREIVPGYELLEVAGKGGMGVVYRARQLNLDRIVAIKTMLVSQIDDSSLVARFEQEARTVANLRHPNVVMAHDLGQHGGRLFLVMEFIDGYDASELVDRAGPLPEAAAWELIRQTASGLAHAASQNVVHRDIKPANLMLVAPPEGSQLPQGARMVKIADFGLAYLRTDVEKRISSGKIVGSPHYMAPEQFQAGEIDKRADIYALGATAFHLLCGVPPFDSLTLPQIIAAKIKGETPQAPEQNSLSEASREFIRHLMAASIDERIQDYDEVIARAGHIANSESASLPASAELLQSERSDIFNAPTEAISSSALPSQKELAAATDAPRGWIRVALSVVVLSLFALAIAWPWISKRSSPGTRDMVASGWAQYLFDGNDLNPWLQGSSGQWITDENQETAKVLAGSNGVARRRLFRRAAGIASPLEHFSLSLVVELNKAQQAEVRFGASRESDNGPNYFVLRINRDAIALGENRGGKFLARGRPLTLNQTHPAKHSIAIERHRSGWWISVNNQLLGSIRARQEERPEFQLAVVGGPAWFSDILVAELTEAQKSSDSGQR